MIEYLGQIWMIEHLGQVLMTCNGYIARSSFNDWMKSKVFDDSVTRKALRIEYLGQVLII